jgi:hypothetical protein
LTGAASAELVEEIAEKVEFYQRVYAQFLRLQISNVQKAA